MEELLPLNNNNENDNQDNLPDNMQQPIVNELKSEDYQIIIFNFLPSSIYCLILSIILLIPKYCFYSNIKEYEEESYKLEHIFSYLKIMLIIFLCYIIKSIFYYLLVLKIEINSINYLSLISFIYFIIDLLYYVSTIAGYYSFSKLSLSFIINNLYPCIFIYYLIFAGIVHICLFFVSAFYILLFFLFSLHNFQDNEMGFIVNQRELPIILEPYLITKKANDQYCSECYICLENIEKGQDIIILKCNGHHFFHSDCIKKWLRSNISCPLYRQRNIL